MAEIDSSILKLCRISMCPPRENTDVDYLIENANSFEDNPDMFCVEFGTKSPVITVSVGQEINIDDIICYMKNIPVRSQIHGKITEVTTRYIIGEYIKDTDSTSIDILKTKYNLS